MRTISQLLLTFLLNACWLIPLLAAFATLGSWLLRDSTARHRHLLWVAALFLAFLLPALSASRILTDGIAAVALPQQTTLKQSVITRAAISSPVEITPSAKLSSGNLAIGLNSKLAVCLLSFYFIFLGYRSYKLARAWQTTRVIRRSAYATDLSESVARIIARCQTASAARPVLVLCSASVPLPITIGFFKPLIVLPELLLREGNVDLLTSAIGHEFIHVARRDYLLNLIYELIYLPLSFHPAAALLRRRIKQTRELCCDELVAEKVLNREVYARSLVALASSAPPLRRLSVNTTVGIADADILEVRIMTLLKPKLFAQRKLLLLIAVSLLLALPSIAAAALCLRFNLKTQPGLNSPQERTEALQKERSERMRWRVLPDYPEDARAAKIEGTVSLSALIGADGTVQDVQVTKPLYPSLDASAVAAVRQWRYEPYLKDGQPTSRRINVELVFNVRQWEQDQKQHSEQRAVEERALEERAEREAKIGWAVTTEGAKGEPVTRVNAIRANGQVLELTALDREEMTSRQREEREQEAAQQAELAKAARITMDQAIQIARGQNPGTVLECSLVAEHWEAPGRLAKDSQVLYHVVILSSNDSKTTAHVLVNALDGQIVTNNLRGRERRE